MNLDALQDGLFNIARSFRDEGQEVVPIAFLIAPGNGLVQVHLFGRPKSEWRTVILDGIAQTRACAVVVHTEAWVVAGKDAPTAMAAKMAGLDSLEDFPGRTEILQSSMECRDGTTRFLTASISDGKLGETRTDPMQALGGEMVGFFKSPSSGQAPTA